MHRRSALIRLAAAAALLAAPCGAVQAGVWPDADGAVLAHAVAVSYESEEHGIVAFDVTTTTAIRGSLFHRDDEDLAGYVEVDGRPVRKRVLRHVEGGHADDAAALERRGAAPEVPLSRFGMRLPCDRAFLEDYTFDAPVRTATALMLPFHARLRDEAHGDGAIELNPSAARIVRIDFRPAVLPTHASTAVVVISFAALGERYSISRIVHTFTGHIGPLRGSAVSTSSYGNVRMFPEVVAARAAIENER